MDIAKPAEAGWPTTRAAGFYPPKRAAETYERLRGDGPRGRLVPLP